MQLHLRNEVARSKRSLILIRPRHHDTDSDFKIFMYRWYMDMQNFETNAGLPLWLKDYSWSYLEVQGVCSQHITSAPKPSSFVLLCNIGAGPCNQFSFNTWHNVKHYSRRLWKDTTGEKTPSSRNQWFSPFAIVICSWAAILMWVTQ